MSYEAELQQRTIERRQRLGARALPDRGINLRPVLPAVVKSKPFERPAPPALRAEEDIAITLAILAAPEAVIVPPTRKFFPKAQRGVLAQIIDATCSHFRVTREDMLSHRREQIVVYPRRIAMYLAKTMTSKAYTEIGRAFCRDHSTCIVAVQRMAEIIASTPAAAKDVETVRAKLEQSILEGARNGG